MTLRKINTAVVALARDFRSEVKKPSSDKEWGKFISRANRLAAIAGKGGRKHHVIAIWQLASGAATMNGDTQLAISYAEKIVNLDSSEEFRSQLEFLRGENESMLRWRRNRASASRRMGTKRPNNPV